jgi:hypothetical protein
MASGKKPSRKIKVQTHGHFRNVDLEIRSKMSLRRLAEAMGKDVVPMFCGKAGGSYLLCVETYRLFGAAKGRELEKVINELCRIVEQLPRTSRKYWRTAQSRIFDISFESGNGSYASKVELPTLILKRIAKLGASVIITCYGKK